MEDRALERQIAGVAALDEPARRSLYFFVAEQQREVSREEAAKAVGVSRSLAGFHLDKLAEEGLLEVSFRRLSGRVGPGAGRPAKLYRRSERQLEVILPQRSYELAARVFATAIDASGSAEVQGALRQTAKGVGERIGAEARVRAGRSTGAKRLREATVEALEANGYEPEVTGGAVRLRNCPFHALVGAHKQLVCGMNLALLEGLVAGLDVPGATPVLDPQPGLCCVRLDLEPAPDGERP